jgi:hypothetical protein
MSVCVVRAIASSRLQLIRGDRHMRKLTLRYCGALGGLLGPILLQSCNDASQVCETLPDEDVRVCYEIGDFGTSTLAQETPLPPGAECPAGGKRIDTGFDDNDNGILDPNEVRATEFICDGEDGPTGPTGPMGPRGDAGPMGRNALAATYPAEPGEPCTSGGMRVEFGVDENGDGSLQPEEVEGTRYLCHGDDGIGVTGAEGPEGEQGPEGLQGLPGEDGNDGSSYAKPR